MEIFDVECKDSYDESYLYAKGWVDKTEFIEEAGRQYGISFDVEETVTHDVVHGYVRIYGKENQTIYFDKNYWTHFGCFKATFIYIG